MTILGAVNGIVLLAACGSGSGSSAPTYIYWGDGASSIGRANISGTDVSQRFITTSGTFPYTVSVTSTYIYWTNPLNGIIGRATLNGTDINQQFITGASTPVGVTVSSQYIYWSNNKTGTIGRADLNGTDINQRFITTAQPSGPDAVVFDSRHILLG